MDEIKDRLGEYKFDFFTKLQHYVGTELLFYGSIKRYDYFPSSSDIDITIITDNVTETITKAHHFLHVKKTDIKKIYQRLPNKSTNKSTNVIIGHKLKYNDVDNDVSFDILIYDEKYRQDVIQNIHDINNLPTYMIVILCILKYMYYVFGLISYGMYVYLKNFVFYCYFNGDVYYNKELTQTIIVDNS
ncbi:MAG: hypothetical protein MUP82_04115 [Candidatus Marinimicrobia bacterium]|nr:hypothetical protein [Candidatus Neomarinimicrobiota bacterium]